MKFAALLGLAALSGCGQKQPVIEPANPCAGVACSSQGSCAVLNGTDAVCVCSGGFFAEGLECKAIVAGAECEGVTCDGRGVCVVLSGMPNTPKCECNAESMSAGATTCVAKPTPCAGVTCSGHGSCAVAGTMPVCVCEADFRTGAGNTCEPIVVGQECQGVDCGGHGTCAVAGGAPLCSCEAGYDRLGTTCVARAVPDGGAGPCAGVTCSGRGQCGVLGGSPPTAACFCNAGYVASGLACVLQGTVGGSLSLLAGALGGAGFVDGTGTAARFFSPRGIAVDGSGTVFVADSNNHMIRRVTAAGVVTTMAGRAQVSGLSNGSGATASFNEPTDIAMGPSGDLFVADQRNHQLRRISPAGDVSLFAGSPIRASGNADGLGAAARFDLPNSLAIDASGGLLVASSLYSTPLRTVTPAGLVSSLTSTPEFVLGLAVFANRSRAFRLEPSRVQEVSLTTGALTLIAGATSSGFTDATGGAARFNGSGRGGIATNSSDRLFVADAKNNAIRVISYPGGVVTTLAGAAQGGFVDGTGSAARFSSPQAIAFAAGALYVTDTGNHAIRRVDVASGAVTTLAGAAPMFGSSNGTGAAARFGRAKELVADSAGNWYVADFDNNAIRRVTPSGIVSTLASGISSTGGPTSIAIDGAGNLYVGNLDGTLRRVTPAGVVSTLQSALDATASAVNSIAVDASGTTLTWITRGNVVWRKVGAAAPIQLRSAGTAGYFNRVAVSGGRTYLVYGNTLKIIESDGSEIALAGCGTSCPDSSLDGVGSGANLGTVQQMVVASDGSVLWADSSGHAIRRAALDGTVTTVVGTLNRVGVTLGALPGILNEPTGVAVDPSGKIGILMGAPLAFSRTGGVGALLIAEL